MFRILAWRLGFELKNIQKLINGSKNTVNYFAFGANLDPEVLKRRKIIPLSEKPFILKDYALRFSHPGGFMRMGFASLDEAQGEVTYGKLYTLTEIDAIRMDYYELVPFLNRYQRCEIEQDGEKLFFYHSSDPRAELQPTQKYLNLILNGFKNVTHVPKEYLDKLASTETLKEMIPADDIQFLYKVSDNYPKHISNAIKKLDKESAKFFLKYVKEKSLTERFINV